MERSEFHKLMERYVKGDVTEQEKLKIETWLNVLEAENISDADLSKEEEDALFRRITSNMEGVDNIVAFRPKSRKKKQRTWMLGIAAGILLLTVLSIALLVDRGQSSTLQVVVSGDTEKIILNDGSIAWLKKGSKLVYYERKEESIRYGELEGEGLFEIAKDPSRPFVLKGGAATIRVVGTSFRLRSRDNELQLWVLTGQVKVSSSLTNRVIDVHANEKISWTKGAPAEPLAIETNEKESVTAGTDYDMAFDDVALSDVLDRLARKFNVNVQVENNSINRCRITADFTDHSLESTLLMISEVTDVRYRVHGDHVVIEGQGCKIP